MSTEEIDGFKVDFTKLLGEGGYGFVYEAKCLQTGEIVAAKQIRTENEKQVDAVVREVENMKKVSHLNLVKCLHHYKHPRNEFWVFMELCDLGDLVQYFVVNNPDEQERYQLMKQMATGIKFLHDSKVVHRDIKPVNILLKFENQVVIVKITDFGLAKLVDSNMISFTTARIRTRMFMAPELFLTDMSVRGNKLVDIFALGLTFYSMICFKDGDTKLVPSEDNKSSFEIGFMMYVMQGKGEFEEAESYHEQVIELKGDETQRKMRELIQKMIQCDVKRRPDSSTVVQELDKIINSVEQQGATTSGDSGLQKSVETLSETIPVAKSVKDLARDYDQQAEIRDSGYSGSQKSKQTSPQTRLDIPVPVIRRSLQRPNADQTDASPDSAAHGISNTLSQTRLNIPEPTGATAASPGASETAAGDSGFTDSQMLQGDMNSLTVIKSVWWIEAVRSNSHNLTRAASVIPDSWTKHDLQVRLWDVTDHKNQSWTECDVLVEHSLNLGRSPLDAHVITILENMLLLRVDLGGLRSQVIAVDPSSSRVTKKSQVYICGWGGTSYCCYKSQIMLCDLSSGITQLDAETLNHLNTWTHEGVGPWRVCSNNNRAAVYDWHSHSISVFRFDDVLLSHDMIYTVECKCMEIQLLDDDTVMAINMYDQWSVFSKNGTPVHTDVQHPPLVAGMGISWGMMQDPVSRACFVQELGEPDGTGCTVIYSTRIVKSRLETGDKSRIDKSQLELSKTIKDFKTKSQCKLM